MCHEPHTVGIHVSQEICSSYAGYKPASTPIKANVNLWCDDSHPRDDPGQYKKLIDKLIYLTVTRLV